MLWAIASRSTNKYYEVRMATNWHFNASTKAMEHWTERDSVMPLLCSSFLPFVIRNLMCEISNRESIMYHFVHSKGSKIMSNALWKLAILLLTKKLSLSLTHTPFVSLFLSNSKGTGNVMDGQWHVYIYGRGHVRLYLPFLPQITQLNVFSFRNLCQRYRLLFSMRPRLWHRSPQPSIFLWKDNIRHTHAYTYYAHPHAEREILLFRYRA